MITRYGLDQSTTWEDAEEFLSLLAVRLGKLKKGGEPDISTAARISKPRSIIVSRPLENTTCPPHFRLLTASHLRVRFL